MNRILSLSCNPTRLGPAAARAALRRFVVLVVALTVLSGGGADHRAFASSSSFLDSFISFRTFSHDYLPDKPLDIRIPNTSAWGHDSWFAGRFDTPGRWSTGPLFGDGKLGGGHASGGSADDPALLFQVPSGYNHVQFSFNWRNWQGESTEPLVVGYYVGDLGVDKGSNGFHDFLHDDFGGDRGKARDWWNRDWVELTHTKPNTRFKKFSFDLPDDTDLWVAIWPGKRDHKFGKIYDIKFKGDCIPKIPEPSSFVLLALGLVGAGACRLRSWVRRRNDGRRV